MTTRSRWKFRICTTTNDLTLYSFSSLYIFVTWGWPTVGESCQPNKTDTKTVVFWCTYPFLIYLCYVNGRIMQIIGFPNIIDLFTCCKIFFCSETFTKLCGKKWGLVLGYTTYVTAYFHCCTMHAVELLNYYTNHCTYIKFYRIYTLKH